ncbi:unnamed protein product [Cylindrotheca closterium]|uniref:PWWP domain-containing protein n=1 Tax=Cylindrotheca closterium TaxID=2856 RepID=A0AAD2FPS6_9STRA|nr:unnamed protein product [Cylindrotheca closterium]
MANKSGMFLQPEQRLSLIVDIQREEKDEVKSEIGTVVSSKCKVLSLEADGLDQLIGALPSTVIQRFSEVCWAQGGIGFGYWPAIIYDPRLAVGSARLLAKKHLGKRYLVFFFECHDAPFTVLAESKIQRWEGGLVDDLHLGKTARSSGKLRFQAFQQALQAARIEAGKPKILRMDWNHKKLSYPSPKDRKSNPLTNLKREREEKTVQASPRRLKRGFKLLSSADDSEGRAQSSNLFFSIENIIG